MKVKAIELKNYRNYESLDFRPDKNINIIYGNNAQGKTNILESLYLAATSKSHRINKDSELIENGKDEAHIKVVIEKNSLEYRIDMHLKKHGKKGIAINAIPIKKAVDLYGIINVVMFSPEDIIMLKGGPEAKRRYIDMEISQISKLYLENLINYNKVLGQRNALLKKIHFEGKSQDLEMLDVWDLQMIKYGSLVIEERIKFINHLSQLVGQIHSNISDGKEKLEIIYEPSTQIDDFDKSLKAKRDNDIRLKYSSLGPHRDDLRFLINDKDTKFYGSQGQIRTVALSLKLAEIKIIRDIIHDDPILLLDDVMSELDEIRQDKLLNTIGDIQTLITCTGIGEFINSRISVDRIFEVINGQVFEINGNSLEV